MVYKAIKKISILIILGSLLNVAASSYAKEIPFTQDGRGRLIRLETKVKEFLYAWIYSSQNR